MHSQLILQVVAVTGTNVFWVIAKKCKGRVGKWQLRNKFDFNKFSPM